MTKELATAASADSLNALANMFPTDPGYTRTLLPRLTFVSQDKTEGKGKNMKVIMEAGTFVEERETDELNDDGKKIWSKTELGLAIEGIILYQRKQLRYYDEATEEFTSSPIFDTDDEIVPLFCNKVEKHRGTPAELKTKFQYTAPDGKVKSKLEENRVLYILKDGEIFQLNLRGSSMYSFLGYTRKTLCPSVLTHMASEPKEKGSIEWNQMTFTPVRVLTQTEVNEVVNYIESIRNGIAEEKAYFAGQAPAATPGAALPAGDPDF